MYINVLYLETRVYLHISVVTFVYARPFLFFPLEVGDFILKFNVDGLIRRDLAHYDPCTPYLFLCTATTHTSKTVSD